MGRGGGLGPKSLCTEKRPDQILPFVNFVFSHDGHFGLGGTSGVVKQDKSSGGSVDTTKTRSGPQNGRTPQEEGGVTPPGPPPQDQSDHCGKSGLFLVHERLGPPPPSPWQMHFRPPCHFALQVSGALLDKLDAIGQRLRDCRRPFGGLQLIFCGDFLQLPPITRGALDCDFAFDARCWPKIMGEVVELVEVFRQRDPVPPPPPPPLPMSLPLAGAGGVSVVSGPRGAACSNSRPPSPSPSPSPPDPPKFSNPSFTKLRFWGKVLAPKALNFFFWPPDGVFFFTLRVYTQNTQNLVESSQMGEKHTKKFDPDLTSGSDLG